MVWKDAKKENDFFRVSIVSWPALASGWPGQSQRRVDWFKLIRRPFLLYFPIHHQPSPLPTLGNVCPCDLTLLPW